MRVDSIDGFLARCSARGVSREVSLFLLEEGSVKIGDQVLVHVGYAIQIVSDEEAEATWEIFDEVLSAEARE
jgi:hydrogenase expression/formation protein HypC